MNLSDTRDASTQKKSIADFISFWKGKGYEKGESQKFWLSLLSEVLGAQHPERLIRFEDQVHLDHTSFIDGYIDLTHVMIEQKSIDKDLRQPIRQTDNIMLTPFQQAKRYAQELSYSQRPRWIVTSNFKSFLVYDMENPNGEPEEILLENLDKERYRLQFLIDSQDDNIKKEMAVSLKAGDLVGVLYDELLKQYKDPLNPESLKSLNKLCVRIVFCLYAEDAGLFGKHTAFHDYLSHTQRSHVREALISLFKTLDTKPEDRDAYMDEELASFPYVNGGLFSDDNIEIPRLNDEIVDIILRKASEDFDWCEISPTIFGAVFESTLNPETRRKGGMHYTAIENIHKVIDRLFLDDLKSELAAIKDIKVEKTRNKTLNEYQAKLSSLTFLDPACGSGNFLTETFICLRRLENEALKCLYQNASGVLGAISDPVKISITQFYGLEINDFAVTVAKTALWIAESQMLDETTGIVNYNSDFFPLTTNASIIEYDALKADWALVVPPAKLTYIIGNPPFSGARLMSQEQKDTLIDVFGSKWKNVGNLDFVCAWYKKAADYMAGTHIKAALVSTNSITQGEQVPALWKPLFEQGIKINFAYRTFRWDSEASVKAHVHCVIIGFSYDDDDRKTLINEGGNVTPAQHINAYLTDGPDAFIESRSEPICDVPEIGIGNKPIDGGNYLFKKEEMEDFIKKEPASAKWFRPWIGAEEFINRKSRYCLWLGDCPPNELRQMPECLKRVQAVREFRLNSTSEGTRKLADKPTRFHVENMPESNYLLIPRVSSENRRYIPIGFIGPSILSSDSVHISTNATLYHFGVLTSNVHMAWMRAVAGRLKSDYRYSKDIVYNNFPWPSPSQEQKLRIERTAQAILDARALFSDSSLADLYDEAAMPTDLRKAHQDNDRAVMSAYGFPVAAFPEPLCVSALFRLYLRLTRGGDIQ